MIRLTTEQERQLDEALDKLGHDLRTPNVARATSSKELFIEEVFRIILPGYRPDSETWHGPL